MMKLVSFETLKDLKSTNDGLADTDVTSQRSQFGSNEIVEVTGNIWLKIAKDTSQDAMIWFLLGVGILFFLTGETKEGIVLFIAIVPLVFMDAILHWRTQASTAGLRGQLTSHVDVIRGLAEVRIDSRELVPGDLIIVSPGLMLPADGIFQDAENIQIDESVLTGEAFPITKINLTENPFSLALAGEVPVASDCLGYAGTKVLTGHGRMRILFTGKKTSYGEIVQSVTSIEHEKTALQKSITSLVQWLIFAAATFCLLLAGIRIYQGHGWLDAILSASTLALAAIPEEFPIAFAFFLGVGVYRMAKKRALVRRAVSVENIGRVTHICTDKTGTITLGRLELTHIDPVGKLTQNDLLQIALEASCSKGLDPIDLSIQKVAQQRRLASQHPERIFPFTEDRKRETVFVLDKDTKHYAFMKGSPETVLLKSSLSESERKNWMAKIDQWASDGHKVIACAKKEISKKEVEQNVEPENGFDFCGLLAFEDPPRAEVAEAMSYCRKHEIGVLMITGDHPYTSASVAKTIGLGAPWPVVISAEEEPQKFEEKWLAQNPKFLLGIDVAARCTPLQKLRIVNSLKKSGQLVAVTGDGVNDVPALKAADIGIAMGERGSRSAKEVSSIILADDNFSTIISAIMEGRQLFANLKMSFEYLILIHIPFVITAALIPLLGYPLLYYPVHIVWLELVIHPTALLAFQKRASVDQKSPGSRGLFFSRADLVRMLFLGSGLSLALGYNFITEINESSDLNHARSKVMATLTLWSGGLALSFTGLKSRNSILIALATILSSVLLIQVPSLAESLHLSSLHFTDWITGITIVLAFVLSSIIAKKVQTK
jgi:Ca2+-transporting ATPase